MEAKERELTILVTKTDGCPFKDWLSGLRDEKTIAAVHSRLYRAQDGNFGDWKPLEAGVIEMRIDFGPGYRIYLALHEDKLIVLLFGGDKSTQVKDIRRAVALWQENKDATDRFRRGV